MFRISSRSSSIFLSDHGLDGWVCPEGFSEASIFPLRKPINVAIDPMIVLPINVPTMVRFFSVCSSMSGFSNIDGRRDACEELE